MKKLILILLLPVAVYGQPLNISIPAYPPGGSDSYVIYNDGGTFGGDPNLTWDDVNDVLYVWRLQFSDENTTPSLTGELRYDNTVTGLENGMLVWYDSNAPRYLVDLKTAPSNDDYVVAYDADADFFYMKEEAGSDPNSHDAVTVTDSQSVDLTLSGQDITADVNDKDYGDITVSGTGATWSIDANAVQLSELDVSDVSDDIAGDIAEGELADSIIVSADIKDGEVDISSDTNLAVVDLLTLTDDTIDANTAAIVEDDALHLATNEQIYDFVIGLGYITEDPNTHDAVTVSDSQSVNLTLSGQDITADVNDKDYGDVTVSGTGATWTVDEVTVSDDENTDDAHEIVFTTDNSALESDGDLTYNPNSGLISATALDLTGITNGNIPYMSASGFADSPLGTDGDTVTLVPVNADTDGYFNIYGSGTGKGVLILYDQDANEYYQMYASNGKGYIDLAGSSPQYLNILYPGTAGVRFFEGSSEGVTQEIRIQGYRTGDATRSLQIGVGVDANDTASFDGLSYYRFDGLLQSNGLDAVGAVDLDYGSADITDHTFITDGGTAIIDGSYQFPDADGTPSATGELQYDNTVAGVENGMLVWYDSNAPRYLVDLKAAPSDDDYVVAYDAAADFFYMKEDTGADPNTHDAVTISDSNSIDFTLTGQLITADINDRDYGDITVSATGSTWSFDDDTVSTAEMADADHGDFTYSGGSASLDNDVVASAELADEDWGDVAISGGAASVEAIQAFDADAGTHYIGMFEYDTGSNIEIFTDGALSYAQATGTLSATAFSGDGSALTGLAGSTSFFAEDGDGTEVEIADSNEWKFIDSNGIDINWTDTDNGEDADPFDLTFTVAGVNGAYGAGWNGDVDVLEKDDIYDYLHQLDTDDDGDIDNVESTLFVSAADANEWIADMVGTMVTGNTETNITVTYQDADNTLDFVASAGGSMTFFAEDGDGTEVEIADSNEWKFIDGNGIDINWTDTDNGEDADPFDLTFTVAGVNGAYGAGWNGDVDVAEKDDIYDQLHLYDTDDDGDIDNIDGVVEANFVDSSTIDFTLADSNITGSIIADSVDSQHYNADSIDNEHINWADIDNLGDEGLPINITISDDESTDDEHEVVFTTDNLAPESDGDFTYNPNSGTVTATEFSGGGASLTSVDAITGDSATAFFDAGNIEHEWGGLEADVSGYGGLVGINGGTTIDVNTSAEVATAIADETGSGALVFGTAPTFTTGITLTGADADPDAAGNIRYDNSIGVMSGGGLRWYDNDSVRLIVDLETDPSDDDYVVAYDSAADGFYMKQDADSGGATAWDDIGDPDGAGVIDFGVHISQLDVNDLRIGATDAGNYIKFAGNAVTFVGTGDIDLPDDSVDTADIGTNQVGLDALNVSDVSDDIAADIAEGELADSIVVSADIKDDTIDSADYAADSIDNEHINWVDIDNLGDEGLPINITISDDEATDDEHEVVFTTDNLAPESDGDFTYNPNSGTVTATEFSGGGASLTSVDAATGDSATAFFDAGTIEHEWGGLQADISGYTGLIAITGADTTAEIDSLDELEGQLADVTRIVSEAVMPVAGTDPDVDAAGELSVDTDGANEVNDVTLRVTDTGGDTQYALAQVRKQINFYIESPDGLTDPNTIMLFPNFTGMSFVVTEWYAWSDTDNVSMNLEEITDDTNFSAARTTVDAIEIATDGTGVYYATDTTITAATIEADNILVIDFDQSDTPGWVGGYVAGYLISNVD